VSVQVQVEVAVRGTVRPLCLGSASALIIRIGFFNTTANAATKVEARVLGKLCFVSGYCGRRYFDRALCPEMCVFLSLLHVFHLYFYFL